MRRDIAIGLLCALVMSLLTIAAAPTAAHRRMALITTGSAKDSAWNRLAFEAATAIQDKHGWILGYTAADEAAAYKSALRDYANEGYNLIICHDARYLNAAREIATQFPNSMIVVSGSADGGRGIATLDIRLWDASYLCGVLAARLVPDGPAGIVGPRKPITVTRMFDAFVNGLRSVKPAYPVEYKYVARPNDPAQTKHATRRLIDKHGVKVIFQNTGAAAAVFEAASGVYVFGANSNQNRISPTVVPASAVIDMQLIFRTLTNAVEDETFEPKTYTHNLVTGGVDIWLNPAVADKWPAGTLQQLEKTKQAIIAGQIDVLKAR